MNDNELTSEQIAARQKYADIIAALKAYARVDQYLPSWAQWELYEVSDCLAEMRNELYDAFGPRVLEDEL